MFAFCGAIRLLLLCAILYCTAANLYSIVMILLCFIVDAVFAYRLWEWNKRTFVYHSKEDDPLKTIDDKIKCIKQNNTSIIEVIKHINEVYRGNDFCMDTLLKRQCFVSNHKFSRSVFRELWMALAVTSVFTVFSVYFSDSKDNYIVTLIMIYSLLFVLFTVFLRGYVKNEYDVIQAVYDYEHEVLKAVLLEKQQSL